MLCVLPGSGHAVAPAISDRVQAGAGFAAPWAGCGMNLDRAAALLASASAVVCLTGAGVSAESGVPTFRAAQTGLWQRYDAEELASPAGFRRDPGLVWRWYMWRLETVERAEPNPGHRALARLAEQTAHFTLITQNVDPLHERAGSPEVIHLHGELARFRCHDCRRPYADLDAADRRGEMPPRCPRCGGFVRPDVVWFGETLPAGPLEKAIRAAQTCDVMLVVGTSGLVHPAAQLPHLARAAGAVLIDVNPQAEPLSRLADLHLPGPSGQLLPRIVSLLAGD